MITVREELLQIVRDLKEHVARQRFDYLYPGHVYPFGPNGMEDADTVIERMNKEKPKMAGKKRRRK